MVVVEEKLLLARLLVGQALDFETRCSRWKAIVQLFYAVQVDVSVTSNPLRNA